MCYTDSDTFDDVIVRNGLLIGTFGSCMELFNVTEHASFESLVVQRLVELDEQRGELTHVYASNTNGGQSRDVLPCLLRHSSSPV